MADTKRTVIVTGAARGIGQSIALELGTRGYLVALNDLQPADETLRLLRDAGAEGFQAPGDVSDEDSVTDIVASVVAHTSHIDALVNNAGISFIRPAEETDLAGWRRVLEVNLTGPFLLCREVGKVMLAQGSGSIVNIASIAGLLGFADRAAYNVSKHGLIGLTRTLAVEWGGKGIRVNAVCPGWVKTAMDDLAQSSGIYTDADITDRIPMARFATPEDIARAVAFLLDPAASAFINGQCLAVDGGWSIDGGWQSLRLSHR